MSLKEIHLRNTVVPIVDEMIEKSPTERVSISLEEIESLTGIRSHILYNFLKGVPESAYIRAKGIAKGKFSISKTDWYKFKRDLYIAEPVYF
jgi:hypothetical protein